jgi:hypothetical protein
MRELSKKKDLLEKANYRYHFSRDIYYNRGVRKVFSLEAIEDNDSQWLSEKISAATVGDQWQFFFNDEPSEKIKAEILRELGA